MIGQPEDEDGRPGHSIPCPRCKRKTGRPQYDEEEEREQLLEAGFTEDDLEEDACARCEGEETITVFGELPELIAEAGLSSFLQAYWFWRQHGEYPHAARYSDESARFVKALTIFDRWAREAEAAIREAEMKKAQARAKHGR